MNNKLLVIIVTYNSQSIIDRCLSSLKVQEFQQFNILVIDNASKDNTSNYIKEISKEPLWKGRIVTKNNQANLGFAKAVNVGLRKARKDNYSAVLLLNPDSELQPTVMLDAMKILANNKVGACSPVILYPDGKVWWQGTHIFNRSELLDIRNFSISRHINKGGKFHKSTNEHEVDAMTGCALFINASALNKVSLFDERYFMYCEDTDYSIRLRKAGYKLICFTTSKVIHDIDDRTALRPILKFRKYKIYLKSVAIYIKKYFGMGALIMWISLLPLAIGREMIKRRSNQKGVNA